MMKDRASAVAAERELHEARAREASERYEAQVQEMRRNWLVEAENERRRADENRREVERRRDDEIVKLREQYVSLAN